ncbi:MAG: hypothetical protein KAR47_20565 [Planctomycetes bacterium]|nr:hypothetical protein [Planctomycetota bacterium]
MKYVSGLLAVFICLSALAGCTEPHRTTEVRTGQSAASEDSDFPEIMVGIWETLANDITGKKWGIKFERDGSVKRIIHYLAGPVDLAEGGKLLEGAVEDEFALFIMGPCDAVYDPETEMLEVNIVVDSYTIQKPTFKLEGKMTDLFSGPVSENGTTWETERRTYATLEGTESPSDEFVDANPDIVTFYKQDISGLSPQ